MLRSMVRISDEKNIYFSIIISIVHAEGREMQRISVPASFFLDSVDWSLADQVASECLPAVHMVY